MIARDPMKFDFKSLGNIGAVLYTQDFLKWDSECNAATKDLTKTIIAQVIRDVKYMVNSLKVFEQNFVRMTMLMENDWPCIHLQFSNPETTIDCWVDFHALQANSSKVIRNTKINNRITLGSISTSDTINKFLTRY